MAHQQEICDRCVNPAQEAEDFFAKLCGPWRRGARSVFGQAGFAPSRQDSQRCAKPESRSLQQPSPSPPISPKDHKGRIHASTSIVNHDRPLAIWSQIQYALAREARQYFSPRQKAMITVDQALDMILSRVDALGTETVALEVAHGRILAQEVLADLDLPPFDRARMDGYALRSDDACAAPVSLKVVGEIAAGACFDGVIRAGEAIKIFTGAPVPKGADAVQKVEVTESDGATVTDRKSTRLNSSH